MPTKAQQAAGRKLLKTQDVHRQKLVKLAEEKGASRLKSLYDRAQDEIEAKLRKLPLDKRDTFTAQQLRVLMTQVQQGQMELAERMTGEMTDLSREAQVASLRDLNESIVSLEKQFTGAEIVLPTEEASIFWGVIDKRAPSLLRAHAESMARYGDAVVGSVQEQLALSLATGETTAQAIDRVQPTIQGQWWQAERIVRTEYSYAFNATHADGIQAVSAEVDDLYQQWIEHVDDSGRPLDDRVGEDSIVLHGQVVKAGGMFVMPPDPRVSKTMWNKRFAHPPNRPNDRAVLTAWRPGWGGLAWEWVAGRRVDR